VNLIRGAAFSGPYTINKTTGTVYGETVDKQDAKHGKEIGVTKNMAEESVQRFYSNGKLLLTGEYLVLQGALSLALPTNAGQFLYVHSGRPDDCLSWNTTVLAEKWFHCIIRPDTWEILETDKKEVAGRLVKLLRAATELKGEAQRKDVKPKAGGPEGGIKKRKGGAERPEMEAKGKEPETAWLQGVNAASEVTFNIEWGLGSSSSLISNIARWAGVDPFRLLRKVSRGSGYDVACARSDKPILYRTGTPGPEIRAINFSPSFSERLAFVYLGRKQDSSKSVKKFLDHALVREKDIIRISELSENLAAADTLGEYEDMLAEHENIMSAVLDKPPVKEVLFRDYTGAVKSLGAWGGDFIHVSLHPDLQRAKYYFSRKGLDVLIPYREMIK
jgi:mevalonate kinase